MVPSPPVVQNATRPSSSHYNISGLEIVRRRHSRHTSVNKDPLLFSCTSQFYTAQVQDVHVQKERVFLIKLKYVGCSQPLWHGFLRGARAASSWPYITASLIIAACVYLRSCALSILGRNSGLCADLTQHLFSLCSATQGLVIYPLFKSGCSFF